jgi:hypothetical protein
MFGRLRFPLRHPFYPGLTPTRARRAAGSHQVLGGSFRQLADAPSRGARAWHAVYIVVDEKSPPAAPLQRGQLWNWFGESSFVLVLNADGGLAAYECEAENGLHVAEGAAVEGAAKGCAHAGVRVRGFRRLQSKRWNR